MAKRVLDIGNCSLDHGAIRSLIQKSFNATVVQAHGPDDTLAHLRDGSFDLVLINRILDRDGNDGMNILQQIKRDTRSSATPVMLVTNYADHQEAAVAEGAVYGFGKAALHTPETRARLAKYLD